MATLPRTFLHIRLGTGQASSSRQFDMELHLTSVQTPQLNSFTYNKLRIHEISADM